MVKYEAPTLDATFSALADPTRRAILLRLIRGESNVLRLAEPFAMSLPAISKHLKVLEQAGLINREREGRVHRIRLEAEPLKGASKWISQYQKFWEGQLDRLANYLNEMNEEDEKWSPNRGTRKSDSRSSAGLGHPEKKSSRPGPTRRK